MNRTFKFALAAVLGVGLIAPAFGQDNFPDVPDNHWAYEALANLKGSVLFGYPDGLYRGNRPLSRYEFAVALNQLYMRLQGQLTDHEDRIAALEEAMKGMKPTDVSDIRNMLQSMQSDVNSMKNWRTDIENFKRLASTFEKELASLGVDVDKLKEDVASIEERLAKLESGEKGGGVNITGDANLLVLGGHSNDGDFGLTPDGRPTGVGYGTIANTQRPVGVTRDLNILHELALNVSGKADENTSYKGTIVFGNTFGRIGSYNSRNNNTPFSSPSGTPDNSFGVQIYELAVTFNSKLAGQGLSATIGRVNAQVGKYLFKRSDFTPYYSNERWDNGNYIWDGAIVGFNAGGASFTLVGGTNTKLTDTNGTELNRIALGAGSVDTTLGLIAGFKAGQDTNIKLAYLIHDSNIDPALNGGINRLSVLGGEVSTKIAGFDFSGAYSQSVLGQGDTNVVDTDNAAWEAALGFKSNNFGINVGYQRIEQNFSAAGSWGRIGTQWSPRNVEGFFGKVSFAPSNGVELYAKGGFWSGVQNGGGFLGEDDDATSITVGLKYDIASNFGFHASYEDVRFDYNVGTDPSQKWFNVGFDYKIGNNSSLMLGYMYSDVDFRNPARASDFGFQRSRYRGGLITTQLSVKF